VPLPTGARKRVDCASGDTLSTADRTPAYSASSSKREGPEPDEPDERR
jgi:hypothetical protein